MGRFKDDFIDISRNLGVYNALRLVLLPRIIYRLSRKNIYSKAVDSFISDNLGEIASRYINQTVSSGTQEIPNIIWVFWWQGEINMPSVINECYQSIIRNANGRSVKLITKENYYKFVKLSDSVMNKFYEKKISFPHFSDILRTKLLIEYGGLWIDAAVFVTKPIVIPKGCFFSPKISNEIADTPHMSQWVIGIMGAIPQMPLFMYLYDMLQSYWQKYDGVFNYLMYDYYIRYAYEHFPWLRKLMDDRDLFSPDIHSTRYSFNQEVNWERLSMLLNNNTFLSLTYRISYPLTVENGNETYYYALLKKSNRNDSERN